MEAIAIVTVVALVQYLVFAYRVGEARIRHGVSAPAVTGPPDFERSYRVQQNTLEQLVVFLPAMWLFGFYVHAIAGAAIGLLFPLGRHVYRSSYVEDPSSRTAGFAIGGLATAVLLIGGAFGALWSWLA